MRNRFLFFFLVCGITMINGQQFNKFDAEGKRHGKWQKKYPNSDQLRYEGAFEHGKEIGEFKFYKPSSGKSPTAIKMFSSTTDTVIVKYFTEKGKVISKGNMIGKERVGTWTYYHNGSSKIMMTEEYSLGKLHGEQKTYFKNGQLTEKTTYREGMKEGKRFMYSDKGVVIKEFTYQNDQLHGITKYYDAEGAVKIEGNYIKDRKDGMWKYYENGELIEQKQFPVSKRGS
ncbi:toxin-antitoxin system YwqK family antitoxin [Aquimarina sp. M1]